MPPAPLQDPLVPVLPGGMVGPELGAGTGGAPEATPPDSAPRLGAESMPGGRQSPLVPPSPETWEQGVETRAHLIGREVSGTIDDGRVGRRIGVVLGLAGIIGVVALVAAIRGAQRRPVLPSPMSVLRDGLRPPGDGGQGGGPCIGPPLTPGSA